MCQDMIKTIGDTWWNGDVITIVQAKQMKSFRAKLIKSGLRFTIVTKE